MAKGRLALSEEMGRIFEVLQEKAHQRSVGAFENLLTAVTNDVIPDQGRIRLTPSYKNNDTHLDIDLDKDGKLEDILEGNGGALTNVVCAGLRFAALTRTSNRRLMVLDESDCWIKMERAIDYFKVIGDVSKQTGTQTFVISHKPRDKFEESLNVIEIEGASGQADGVRIKSQVFDDWNDDSTPGIRGIELFNVRTHVHTFVPCLPGATAYIGDNNLGKSTAITTALRVFAYGESSDALIRHNCEEARIILHLEDKQRLEFSRKRDRSPAVVYKYYKGDTLVTEGRQQKRNEAPDWVSAVLKVQLVDDLDVQIGKQKQPVFLLNESGSKRAKILSVGRESGHLRALMKKYDEQKSGDRETVKKGESEITLLKVRLGYLEKLPPISQKLDEILISSEEVLKNKEECEILEKLLKLLEGKSAAVNSLELLSSAYSKVPEEAPKLFDVESLEKLLDRLERFQFLSDVGTPRDLPTIPDFHVVEPIINLVQRLECGTYLLEIIVPALPEVPELFEVGEITRLGVTLAKGVKALNNEGILPKLPSTVENLLDVADIQKVIKVIAESGKNLNELQIDASNTALAIHTIEGEVETLKHVLGKCPLCESDFHASNHKH
ncbi:hypothetical protein LC612_28575 [Nostoc sp. CHAB 5834]|nr:hypothetical protein [Nostoc sp. CHAB 5834]